MNKIGVDDFIVREGIDALRAVLAAAVPLLPDAELTDLGNATVLGCRAEGSFLYVARWRAWLTWDGRRWVRDDGEGIRDFAVEVVKDLLLDARRESDPDRQKKLVAHAMRSQGKQRIDAMVDLAPNAWASIRVEPTDLDTDRWLFNVENGTIDLRTGLLQRHNPDDLITKLVPVAYDPGARSDLWDKKLREILPDEEVRGFLQRWLGHSLTGDVCEEKLAFLQGAGRNGKGTIIETVLAAVGDYGATTPESLLLARKFDTHPTELADLHGKRLVVANEVGEGREWNAARVKMLTGGDRVKARRMHEDFWEYEPTHKITVVGNHKPRADAEDFALWQRLKVVPFEQTFAGKPDPGLKASLRRTALPAVLAWLVEGCLTWQRLGLGQPRKIAAAVEEYREELRELDPLGPFLATYAIDAAKGTPLKDLVDAFNRFTSGRNKRTSREMAESLRALGYAVRKGSNGGVRVRPPAAKFT